VDEYDGQEAREVRDPSPRAIREQVAERGMKLLMPTLSPFQSNGWPCRSDPEDGTGPSSLSAIWGVDAK
jgi:hypothetical protein